VLRQALHAGPAVAQVAARHPGASAAAIARRCCCSRAFRALLSALCLSAADLSFCRCSSLPPIPFHDRASRRTRRARTCTWSRACWARWT
jgi:hypothetical protein